MRGIVIIGLGFVLFSFGGCVHDTHHHSGKHDFSGHFGDMDANADNSVDWKEFKKYFPHAENEVFNNADSNHDKLLDHDEWHHFKGKHGHGHGHKE